MQINRDIILTHTGVGNNFTEAFLKENINYTDTVAIVHIFPIFKKKIKLLRTWVEIAYTLQASGWAFPW